MVCGPIATGRTGHGSRVVSRAGSSVHGHDPLGVRFCSAALGWVGLRALRCHNTTQYNDRRKDVRSCVQDVRACLDAVRRSTNDVSSKVEIDTIESNRTTTERSNSDVRNRPYRIYQYRTGTARSGRSHTSSVPYYSYSIPTQQWVRVPYSIGSRRENGSYRTREFSKVRIVLRAVDARKQLGIQ